MVKYVSDELNSLVQTKKQKGRSDVLFKVALKHTFSQLLLSNSEKDRKTSKTQNISIA